MAEQAKSTPPTQEHPYPPPVVPYPQPFNGAAYPPPAPPGAYPPPYFAYPPPPDGSHTENGQNSVNPGQPYMMFAPPHPGMLYAFPPPQGQALPTATPTPSSPPQSRPKRKQVKMACTNCAAACKRCDEARPCERCIKYGIPESCVDGQRKERKKGIKRGPYRRKNRSSNEGASYTDPSWAQGSASPPSAATTSAAIHAVAHQFPHPEGYYQVFYPPPGPYLAHPHEGQPGPDGSPPHPNGAPAMLPYYIHPGGYHFPHYPAIFSPPGQPQPPPPIAQQEALAAQQQPTTMDPADAAKKPDEVASAPNGGGGGMNGNGVVGRVQTPAVPPATKKRARTTKNSEGKSKRAKTSRTAATATAAASGKNEGIGQGLSKEGENLA